MLILLMGMYIYIYIFKDYNHINLIFIVFEMEY